MSEEFQARNDARKGRGRREESAVNDRSIKSRGIGRLALTRGEIMEDEGSEAEGEAGAEWQLGRIK